MLVVQSLLYLYPGKLKLTALLCSCPTSTSFLIHSVLSLLSCWAEQHENAHTASWESFILLSSLNLQTHTIPPQTPHSSFTVTKLICSPSQTHRQMLTLLCCLSQYTRLISVFVSLSFLLLHTAALIHSSSHWVDVGEGRSCECQCVSVWRIFHISFYFEPKESWGREATLFFHKRETVFSNLPLRQTDRKREKE